MLSNALERVISADVNPTFFDSDCGNHIASTTANAPATDCNMPCAGNAAEVCGAGLRLNLFWSGQTPPAPPSIPATIGNWTSLGCYT